LLLPDPRDRADLPGAWAWPFDVFQEFHRGVAISAAHGIELHVPEVSRRRSGDGGGGGHQENSLFNHDPPPLMSGTFSLMDSGPHNSLFPDCHRAVQNVIRRRRSTYSD
jgi:hypothetical protein